MTSVCAQEETVFVIAHGGSIRLLLGHVKAYIAEAITEQSLANCSSNESRHDHAMGETEVSSMGTIPAIATFSRRLWASHNDDMSIMRVARLVEAIDAE